MESQTPQQPQQPADAQSSAITTAAGGGHDEDFFGKVPLWTPEIEETVKQVITWIRMDLPGCSVWGLPGAGKTQFSLYMGAVASPILGAGVFAIHIDMHPDLEDDPNELMMDWGRQIKAVGYHHPRQAIRKDRFIEAIKARAVAGGGNRVLMVFDRADRLGPNGLELITSLCEDLAKLVVRPFVMLVGQMQLKEALKDIEDTLALQLERRYFLKAHTFLGIDPADLEYLLDSLDAAATPSVTQQWLPRRAAQGWSLRLLAAPMRKAIDELAKAKNLTRGVRIPMSTCRPAVASLLYDLIAMGESLADLPEQSFSDALCGVKFDRHIQVYAADRSL